jgi:predicted enzyme related to lactoylglutathione lyase
MGDHRWLTLGFPGHEYPQIALYQPPTFEQVGHNPIWILEVDDCRSMVAILRASGVTIHEDVTERPWGTNAVIADLYGNLFNLVQPRG